MYVMPPLPQEVEEVNVDPPSALVLIWQSFNCKASPTTMILLVCCCYYIYEFKLLHDFDNAFNSIFSFVLPCSRPSRPPQLHQMRSH